jgi:hypothetical protein
MYTDDTSIRAFTFPGNMKTIRMSNDGERRPESKELSRH